MACGCDARGISAVPADPSQGFWCKLRASLLADMRVAGVDDSVHPPAIGNPRSAASASADCAATTVERTGIDADGLHSRTRHEVRRMTEMQVGES